MQTGLSHMVLAPVVDLTPSVGHSGFGSCGHVADEDGLRLALLAAAASFAASRDISPTGEGA